MPDIGAISVETTLRVSVNGDFHFSTEFLKVVELALNLEENVKRMMTEEHGRRF